MDRDGDDRAGRSRPRHRPQSLMLGAEGHRRGDGDRPSPPSTSSGSLSSLLLSPLDADAAPSPTPFPSLEKAVAQYSTGAARWARHRLAAVPAPQGFGLSRRHKLLVGWTSLFCLALFLVRGIFSLPSAFSRHRGGVADGAGIYVSGFAARGHHIPSKIWQVMFVDPHEDPSDGKGRLSYDFDPSLIPYSNSWLARNPDWQYTLVGNEGASRFVRRHFAHNQRVLDVIFGLRNHGSRSDLMRYLLMIVEGGVYSDTDVTCLKPVDQWIPLRWRDQVRAVVGIEGDSMGQGVIDGMLWDVQFGQWTLAAAPGHRLFRNMAENVISRVEDLCARKNTTIDRLEMTAIEIVNSTGTALWSETIFRELQAIDPTLREPLDLSGMKEPRLYGDIMVLPIDGIGSGVPHSGATLDEIPEIAIVQHYFYGSWRDTDGIEREDNEGEVEYGTEGGEDNEGQVADGAEGTEDNEMKVSDDVEGIEDDGVRLADGEIQDGEDTEGGDADGIEDSEDNEGEDL